MKLRGRAWVLVLVMLFALATAALAAGDRVSVGWDSVGKICPRISKWPMSREIGNMADFETAASGSSQAACISKGFVAQLKTKTIDQVIAEVDKFYQENPAKLDMPVVAAILQRCTKLCAPAAEKRY